MLVGTNGPVVLEPNLIAENVITAYDDEVLIKFDPVLHRYTVSDIRVQDGAWLQVPSVTTVLGKLLDRSKFLSPWVGKLAQQEFHERIEAGKAYPEEELQKVGYRIRNKHKLVLDQAGKIGGMVHTWIEAYLASRQTGRGFPPPPMDPQVRSAASAARRWIIENNLQPKAVEKILFSRKARVIGTMDLNALVTVGGRSAVCDWKSSRSLHKSYELQTAAYRAMLFEQTGFLADDRILIRLDKEDGTFHPETLSTATADAEAEAFFAMVGAYRQLNELNFFEED